MKIQINCDGGARGNPGPAACAFVAKDDCGNLLEKRGKYLGATTNNVAEYTAVIEALYYVLSIKYYGKIEFFLDSSLVVNQINGLFKVKEPRLRELLIKIRELEGILSPNSISYSYIPREQNQEADKLANETLDKVK